MGSGSGFACGIRLNSSLEPALRPRYQNEDTIRDAILHSKTIAIVGASTDSQKASYFVMSYLLYEGYRVIPVNPKADQILGQRCYPTLRDIPVAVDIVDVFRPAAECPALAEQAIAIGAKVFWTQLRIIHRPAAEACERAGLKVIMDKCVKMEHGRFGGSLHFFGFNTEVLSARKPLKR